MRAGTAVHVAVRDALRDLGPGDVVLVACSGGPDSLALAAATASLAGRYGWRAGAVVVDHGWSAEAAEAGRAAAATCDRLGLAPVELVAVDSSGPGGPEAAARAARYRALDATARRHGAVAVLLGHTLDDQAETVLLGLGRGSGARSLSGMGARVGLYRRPFLALPRTSTVAACAQLGLVPWLDPANDDPAYARVRVRGLAGELERALGPGVVQALARTADLLRHDADALDAAAAELVLAAERTPGGDPAGTPGGEPAQRPPGGVSAGHREEPRAGLDAAVLLAAPAAVRRRALLAAARAAGSPPGALGHRHAEALDRLLTAAAGATIDLPGGLRAELDLGVGEQGERARRLLIRYGPSGRPGMGNLPPSPDPEIPS